MGVGSIVMNEALAEIAGLVVDYGSPSAFQILAVGSGDATPASDNSGLATEITDSGLARASATISLDTVSSDNDTAQLYKQWTVLETKTIKEVGVTNKAVKDAANEKWLYREVIGTQRDVSDGDTYSLTVKVTFARS